MYRLKRRRSVSDEGQGPKQRYHSMVTRSTHQKRLRDSEDELPEAKHHKAFISLIHQIYPDMEWITEIIDEVKETAFAAVAPQVSQKQEVPILKSYKEAI